MKHLRVSIILMTLVTLFLGACEPAATQQAETAAVIPPTEAPTQPPLPSNTPLPTDTPTPVPTSTPTLVPTDTPTPTNTPTITPTPGPFTFFDDFTTNSGGWAECDELCKWENGTLIVGPFPPTSNFHTYACTGCGEAQYYKIAVDSTFVEGQVDRFFGVYVGDANGEQYYLGISPWQFYVVGKHYDDGDTWDVLDIKWSGAVKPSYATNHFEVDVRPANKENYADIIFSLNGQDVYIVYSVPVVSSTVGLAMDWHAVTSAYDNWEYTVLEP